MPPFLIKFVRTIDRVNLVIGRFAMYLVLVMMVVLLFSAVSRSVFNTPHVWVMETAQFCMAAYYLLGGGYSLQQDAHVRMDVFYSRWTPRTQALVDLFTGLALIFYLIMLIYGGVSSTAYALEYGQKNYSSWAPPMAPIKIIMTTGIVLMLFQVIACFCRDWGTVRGTPLPPCEGKAVDL